MDRAMNTGADMHLHYQKALRGSVAHVSILQRPATSQNATGNQGRSNSGNATQLRLSSQQKLGNLEAEDQVATKDYGREHSFKRSHASALHAQPWLVGTAFAVNTATHSARRVALATSHLQHRV